MSKLAIIHTTPATLTSIKEIVEEKFPGTEVYNLLDDSMLNEINSNGRITAAVEARFQNLALNAVLMKADVLLSACSSIGGLIDKAKEYMPIPCQRIDDAMAQEAVRVAKNITVAATVQSTLEPTKALIQQHAEKQGKTIQLQSLLIEEAGALLRSGQFDAYKEVVSKHIRQAIEESECIVLAQASMANAIDGIPENERTIPILTSPDSGVASLPAYLNLE